MSESYQLGITKDFPCNYLSNKQERLLIAIDDKLHNSEKYSWLMSEGFRRSADQIYRPHCRECNACKSVRVLTHLYTPSKSQKRLSKKNQQFKVVQSTVNKDEYYALYENYVNQVHHDGAMYPATKDQYLSFAQSKVVEQCFIEIWDNHKLVSVAVTDILPNALSAVYTFYDPHYRDHSIGMYSIMKQIELASSLNKPYLYLGYQIDDCQKMNYKNKYFPYQERANDSWKTVKK